MNNDLISRSVLLDSFDVRKVTEYDETGCGMEYKAVPVEAIEAAPAVDVEPVRYGRWKYRAIYKFNSKGEVIKYCDIPYCSECGREYGTVKDVPFCNCGAKMDGGAE